MISEILKKSDNLHKFFISFLIFWIIFILANISTIIFLGSDIAIIISAISFWVTIMIVLFISSVVKSIKFYLFLEDLEEEKFKKPESLILKQLKFLSLFIAGLDMVSWISVGVISIIPKCLFISKTKEFKKTIGNLNKD